MGLDVTGTILMNILPGKHIEMIQILLHFYNNLGIFALYNIMCAWCGGGSWCGSASRIFQLFVVVVSTLIVVLLGRR